MFIVAGWGTLPVSRLISCMTVNPFSEPKWGPSHVAILARATPRVLAITGEKDLWIESSTFLPRECLYAKQKVVGIQCHRILDRLADYPDGNVRYYSLSNPLSSSLEEELVDYIFDVWLNKQSSSHPWSRRILFGKHEAQLCSEFVQNVMIATGRSRIRDKRPQRSPAAFLRYHLEHHSIIPESR